MAKPYSQKFSFAQLSNETSANTTTWSATSIMEGLCVKAKAGDLLELSCSLQFDNGNAQSFLDAATYDPSTQEQITSLTTADGVLVTSDNYGFPGWTAPPGVQSYPSGSVFYVVQDQDVINGHVSIIFNRRTSSAVVTHNMQTPSVAYLINHG